MTKNSWSKEKMALYCKELYTKQRKQFFEILGNKCAICNNVFENYVLDHINYKEKTIDVGGYFGKGKLPIILEELKKCQLLCYNCNIKKTKKDLSEIMYQQGITHGSIYVWMKVKCKCAICETAKRKWHDERNEKRRTGEGKGSYKLHRSGPEGTSWCRGHNDYLKVDLFHKSSKDWNGVKGSCKECVRLGK